MRHYFLSDAHLIPEPGEHPGRSALLAFLGRLNRETPPGAIWILGDLFDFWFEFRGRRPSGYDDVLAALRSLTDRGWSGHILPGNHDYWLNGEFERMTGFSLSPDRTPLRVGPLSVFLAHGDGLGRGDIGYRFLLRPLVRARFSAFLFGLLPSSAGNAIARLASAASRKLFRSETLDRLPTGLVEWVNRKLRDNEDLDLVITGHAHLPLRRDTGSGTHISLGDWFRSFTYAVLDDSTGTCELLRLGAAERSQCPERTGFSR